MIANPLYDIGDIVLVKDGYGLPYDRNIVWKVAVIEIINKGDGFKTSYKLRSVDGRATTGFYEEALQKCAINV